MHKKHQKHYIFTRYFLHIVRKRMCSGWGKVLRFMSEREDGTVLDRKALLCWIGEKVLRCWSEREGGAVLEWKERESSAVLERKDGRCSVGVEGRRYGVPG